LVYVYISKSENPLQHSGPNPLYRRPAATKFNS